MNDFKDFIIGFRGEFAALTAAFLWAAVSLYYTQLGRQLSPTMLNLSKGLVALGLFGITLGIRHETFPGVGLPTLGLLMLSGVLGIGLGDTAFFACLNAWGARRTLLMDALSPGMSTVLAWLLLQESLGEWQLMGIGLAIAGVSIVVSDQSAGEIDPQQKWQGLAYGILFVLSQGGGVILSRAALSLSSISPLWSTSIRLAAGVIALTLWVIRQKDQTTWSFQTCKGVVIAAFFSTYLGIWLQQTSLKFAPAGVAQSLSSMGPVFILIIGWLLGESVSSRSWIGMGIAIGGVCLLLQL